MPRFFVALGAGALALLISACGGSTNESAEMAAAAQRASEMADQIDESTGDPAAPSRATADPEDQTRKGKTKSPTASAEPATSNSPTYEEPPEEATPDASSLVDAAAQWAQYPWGSNGLECAAPINSPGVNLDPADPSLVVVMGDSLVRNARDEIEYALTEQGFTPVFVCWGGKNLEWGQTQVATMRSLGVLPQCLVINLGTNDLKGTTAQGLADAVPVDVVSNRLVALLSDLYDVADVFAVNLAADLSMAPSTMADVRETRDVYRSAVDGTGVGAVVDWAIQSDGGGLIGEDGIHDTATGRAVRASLIASAVARDCGN